MRLIRSLSQSGLKTLHVLLSSMIRGVAPWAITKWGSADSDPRRIAAAEPERYTALERANRFSQVIEMKTAASQLFRFPSAVKRDPAIEVWFHEHSGELGVIAQD